MHVTIRERETGRQRQIVCNQKWFLNNIYTVCTFIAFFLRDWKPKKLKRPFLEYIYKRRVWRVLWYGSEKGSLFLRVLRITYICSHSVFHNKVRKFTHICVLVVHVCRYTGTRAKPYNCILALAPATPTRSHVYADARAPRIWPASLVVSNQIK